MWSVCICKLCQPRTEADGKPVTESNLSLRAFAQVAANLRGRRLLADHQPGRTQQIDLCAGIVGSCRRADALSREVEEDHHRRRVDVKAGLEMYGSGAVRAPGARLRPADLADAA
jgi:hypothetical protein